MSLCSLPAHHPTRLPKPQCQASYPAHQDCQPFSVEDSDMMLTLASPPSLPPHRTAQVGSWRLSIINNARLSTHTVHKAPKACGSHSALAWILPFTHWPLNWRPSYAWSLVPTPSKTVDQTLPPWWDGEGWSLYSVSWTCLDSPVGLAGWKKNCHVGVTRTVLIFLQRLSVRTCIWKSTSSPSYPTYPQNIPYICTPSNIPCTSSKILFKSVYVGYFWGCMWYLGGAWNLGEGLWYFRG